jgi:hypothetical protein
MGVGYNPKVVRNGLVLFLDAANRKSFANTGTTWTDMSGSNNNGIIYNAPTYNSSGFITFNGSSQQVGFANTSSLRFEGTLPYTLSVWCNITADPGPSSWARIMDRDNDPGTGRSGYNFYVNQTGGTNLQIFSERQCPAGGGGSVGITVPTSTFLNTWNNFVITYDSTNLIMYRNGVIVSGPAALSGSIVNASATYSLFLYGSNRGHIAANMVYNRALSAAEVSQNFNAMRGRFNI